MFQRIIKYLFILILFLNSFISKGWSEIVKEIKVEGNDRISAETIKMFSRTNIGSNLDNNDLNNILNSLYDSNFFEDVSVSLENNKLKIIVKESPIIENIFYEGIKSNSLKDKITENLNLKPRSSFNKIILKKDKDLLISSLKENGYFFSRIEIEIVDLNDNKADLKFNIDLGEKAKIKKSLF